VFGLTLDALTVSNGEASALVGTDPGQDYTFSVTPAACNVTSGCTVSVTLDAGSCTDLAGNTNDAAGPFTRVYDAAGPACVLTSSESGYSALAAIPFTATFAESVTVTGSTVFNVTGGSAWNLAGSGTTWTFNAVPDADGVMYVQVPASAAEDASGNGNQVSNAIRLVSDQTDPVATLTFAGSEATVDCPDASVGAICTTDSAILVTVSFDEDTAAAVAAGDFTITNAAVDAVTTVSAAEYSANITATAVNSEITVFLPANAVADLAGNSMGVSNTLTVYYNALPYATLVSRSVNYYTTQLTAEFVFSMNQAVTWRWKVVNAFNYTAYEAYQVGSASQVAAGTEQTVTVAQVSEGLNQLYVETTDGTGNVLVTAFDWIVDLTTPATAVANAGGEAINRTFFRTASFELSANDVIPVQAFWWQLDDAAYVQLNATQSTYGGIASVALDSLAVGSHTLRAYAVDRAGNSDAASFAHYTWEVVEAFEKECCEYTKTCLQHEFSCFMSDLTSCERTRTSQRSTKCVRCLQCLRYQRKLVYGPTSPSVQSDAIERCIAAVDPRSVPINSHYYPANTLVFSVCHEDQVEHTCSKYRDWQGVCPVSNPRVFKNKYGHLTGASKAADVFSTHAETRTLHRHLLDDHMLGQGRVVTMHEPNQR